MKENNKEVEELFKHVIINTKIGKKIIEHSERYKSMSKPWKEKWRLVENDNNRISTDSEFNT